MGLLLASIAIELITTGIIAIAVSSPNNQKDSIEKYMKIVDDYSLPNIFTFRTEELSIADQIYKIPLNHENSILAG